MEHSTDKKWYVIHTKPRQERTAEEQLSRQGFDIYLPLLREKKRNRGKWVYSVDPMFPRYLFIHVAPSQQSLSPVRSTRGVSGLVRFGTTLAEISAEFISELRNRESVDAGYHEWAPTFAVGDSVEVVEGPFAGLVAQLRALSASDRVTILVNLFGRENLVTLPADYLVPVSA